MSGRIGRKIDAFEKQLRSAHDQNIESMTTAELREYIRQQLTALGFKCAICGNPIISATPADDRSGDRG
jgi:hypothetical protein